MPYLILRLLLGILFDLNLIIILFLLLKFKFIYVTWYNLLLDSYRLTSRSPNKLHVLNCIYLLILIILINIF